MSLSLKRIEEFQNLYISPEYNWDSPRSTEASQQKLHEKVDQYVRRLVIESNNLTKDLNDLYNFSSYIPRLYSGVIQALDAIAPNIKTYPPSVNRFQVASDLSAIWRNNVIQYLPNFELTQDERFQRAQRTSMSEVLNHLEKFELDREQLLELAAYKIKNAKTETYYISNFIKKLNLDEKDQNKLVQVCIEHAPSDLDSLISCFPLLEEEVRCAAALAWVKNEKMTDGSFVIDFKLSDFKLSAEHLWEVQKQWFDAKPKIIAQKITHLQLTYEQRLELAEKTLTANNGLTPEERYEMARQILVIHKDTEDSLLERIKGEVAPQIGKEIETIANLEERKTAKFLLAISLLTWKRSLSPNPYEDLILNRNYLTEIFTLHAAALRPHLLFSLCQLAQNPVAQEKNARLCFENGPSWYILAELPLSQLAATGVSIAFAKDCLERRWQELSQPHKFTTFLELLFALAADQTLSPSQKEELLRLACFQSKQGPTWFENMQALLLLFKFKKTEQLIPHFPQLTKFKVFFTDILEETLPKILRIEKMQDIRQRYTETFGAYRIPHAILRYIATQKADSNLWIKLYVESVLNKSFPEARYTQPNDKHLRFIENNFPEVFQRWKTNPEKVQFGEALGEETDHPEDLLLAPTEVRCCLNIDGTSQNYNKGLLGYLCNGHTRLLALKRNHKVIAYTLIRLALNQENQPVLFLERLYSNFQNHKEETFLKKSLLQLAQRTAVRLQCPLLSKLDNRWVSANSDESDTPMDLLGQQKEICYNGQISFLGNRAPEYIDFGMQIISGPFTLNELGLVFDPLSQVDAGNALVEQA